MFQVCKFNPKTDICETIPGLSTDLSAAIENGVVLDTGIDSQYNEVDDPSLIRGRVRDAFSAIDMGRSLLSSASKLSTSSVSTPEGGDNA